jgi:hypothetical protein
MVIPGLDIYLQLPLMMFMFFAKTNYLMTVSVIKNIAKNFSDYVVSFL